MKRTLPILLTLTVFCLTSGYTATAAAEPWGVPVKVVDKSSVFSVAHIIANGSTSAKYLVNDDQGRQSTVLSPDSSFQVGQCVTLWRDESQGKNKSTYPRISVAGENCAPLQAEPANLAHYTYYLAEEHDRFSLKSFLLDTWLESTDDQLVASWGAPTSSYKTKNDIVFLTYANKWINDDGYNAWSNECDTTFELHNGKIFSYSYKGNC